MRSILWLVACGAVYLAVAFTVPKDWQVPVEMAYLFVFSMPLWIRPLGRWVFAR